MKKISLLLSLCLVAFGLQAQKLRVTAPSSLVNNLSFDYAENGATPTWGNVAITSTYTNVEVELGDDGGSNPDQGCGTLNNTTMTGKAGMVYRGTCEFGVKAKNVQDAGGIICIIVNNDPVGTAGMAGGTQGLNVNIPVLMIGKTDGDLIKAELALGSTVTISLTPWSYGYDYDIAIEQGQAVRPYNLTQPKYLLSSSLILANNEYYHIYDGASYITNYSAQPIDSIIFATAISSGATPLHTDSILRLFPDTNKFNPTTNPITGVDPDTIDAIVFNGMYDLSTLATGQYDVMTMAEVINGGGDQNFADNVSSTTLTVTENTYSKASLNSDMTQRIDYTFSPVATAEWGQVLHFPLAENKMMQKVTLPVFLRANSGTDDLDGKSLTVNVYRWLNTNGDSAIQQAEFTDNLVGSGAYTFPAGSIVDAATRTLTTDIYLTDLDLAPGDSGVVLSDDAVYWVAVALDGATDIGYATDRSADQGFRNNFFKYSTQNNNPKSSLWSQALISDNGFFSTYAGAGMVAMMVTIEDRPSSVNDVNNDISLEVFPNPATDYANISATYENNQDYIAYEVLDVTGKVIASERVENSREAKFQVSTANLATGSYIIKVSSPEGFNSRTLIKK